MVPFSLFLQQYLRVFISCTSSERWIKWSLCSLHWGCWNVHWNVQSRRPKTSTFEN